MMADPRRRRSSWGSGRATGLLTIVSTVVYLVSDVLEAAHGGFTPFQLWLTLVAEVTLPVFVLGLFAAQRPQIGSLGRVGAIGYALAYVYFTYTVGYALAAQTPDFETLNRDLGAPMTIAGGLMVLSGLAFAAAVYRARLLPRWTGFALAVGVVAVAAALALPAAVQLVAIGLRDVAFLGMGVALIRPTARRERDTSIVLARRNEARRPVLASARRGRT
jgi:hypothetical protein